MTNEERKPIVMRLLAEGRSLSEIQEYLIREKNDRLTYMDLRLLLSEMPDAKLPEKEPMKAPPMPTTPPPGAAKGGKAGAVPAGGPGKLSISVDQTPQPGCVLSGYARFGSGAKAHWMLDDMGRLGLDPELGSAKPNATDMQEFTVELRRLLERSGGAV